MLKRAFTLVLALALVVVACIGCSQPAAPSGSAPDAAASKEPYRIGVAVPLTGGSAELGGQVFRGAEMAVADVNAAGGVNGRMLELVQHDDKADPKEAANLANLLVADDSIIAAIAGYNSACTLAGAPIYNDAKMVHIAVGSSSPKVALAGDYTFRVWNNDEYRAAFDLQILLDAGYTKPGIMYQSDDFGLGALGVCQKLLAEKGLEAPVAEGFLLGETKDFNTMITKMINAGCDSVFCIADESELAAFCVQVRGQGWDAFISSTGTYNPAVPSLGGEAVEGIVGDGFYDPSSRPAAAQSFFERYSNTYNSGKFVEAPTAICAYSAIQILVGALENGASTREDIQKFMATLKDFDTLCGTLSYDENGDTKIPLIPIVIKDGAFALFEG